MHLNEQFYNDFPTDKFEEEARYFCYELSRELIEKAQRESKNEWYVNENTVKAILLLLFCWNFAAKITKKLKTEVVADLLKKQTDNLKCLEQFSIMDDWESHTNQIKKVYADFKVVMGQTGASKALSLLNPKLFVMWDTGIRKFLSSKKADENLRMVGLANGEQPENYISFLIGIKEIIDCLNLHEKISDKNEIAKKIDEYHYVKLIMNRINGTS